MKIVLVALMLAAGCARPNGPTQERSPNPEHRPAEPPQQAPAATPPQDDSDPHHVVFADRTSQAYLLLVDPEHAAPLDRSQLQTLVQDRTKTDGADTEFDGLAELIGVEPNPSLWRRTDGGPPRDLLGLHLESIARHGDPSDVIAPPMLRDPVLTRTLTREQRQSLPSRTSAVLLRAHYRNQHHVRGLRLLQEVVRVVATERDALIHDPDTGETLSLKAFLDRQLHANLDNIADQIAVVPFPDPRHEGFVRLTTRGMRRFGGVDIELDGLRPDTALLQTATHMVYGLARVLVTDGELDASGYAVELAARVEVGQDDITQAYGRSETPVAACDECPGVVVVHLVERPAESHDPPGHLVARVVAPRPQSDAPDYDQRAWVADILTDLFGP